MAIVGIDIIGDDQTSGFLSDPESIGGNESRCGLCDITVCDEPHISVTSVDLLCQ